MTSPALLTLLLTTITLTREYGPPDRDHPGDEMIQEYLRRETDKIHARFSEDLESLEKWKENRPRLREEYLHSLGLWPLPEKTPLQATVTGIYRGDGFIVEKLHYQSMPHLYVTSNLYRPEKTEGDERHPAILYVCGHSGMGRNGNKTAFQSHGIWFARHGYICLIVDTLQWSEIAGLHHGTCYKNRWWWHSRGYTPAGVECWNGIRGIDYLLERKDVDSSRIAVTGISGGGASTARITAADDRVKVSVPVSGLGDLPGNVTNRVIKGHCDCMFMYNTFRWPWVRIPALAAPRPQLFVNSDHDAIFPMDANERIINSLERLYSLFGAGDRVDSVVSIGGHDYRKDIRQAVYRFINLYLKGDPALVLDSEVDIVHWKADPPQFPIPPEELRVFPGDDDIPADQLNQTIDQYFVPLANVKVPEAGNFDAWKQKLNDSLRKYTFGTFPERIPPARLKKQLSHQLTLLETESSIAVPLKKITTKNSSQPKRVLLVVTNSDASKTPDWIDKISQDGDAIFLLETRGIGSTRWTKKDTLNYVRRSHLLLGRTEETGRVWDVIATARYLATEFAGKSAIHVVGKGTASILASQAALWETDIAGAILVTPPTSFMDPEAPQFLNILRTCDIPETLGLLAPRPLLIVDGEDGKFRKTAAIYAVAEAGSMFFEK